MDKVLYFLARGLICLVQSLPLAWVARLGRIGGAVVYALDRRHRRVAIANLNRCLGSELPARQLRALARENFRRIGENFACAARTAVMNADEIRGVLDIQGAHHLTAGSGSPPTSCVMAIGHFGNFESYARANLFIPGYQMATTYRALRQPSLNRLLQALRERSGCLYFERRSEADALRHAMTHQPLMIGFLADQHAGNRGVRVPFLGHDCSTSTAPALFARRYHAPLFPAICYRTAPARWRIEIGPAIPTHAEGSPRTVEAITRDINAAFEAAVRRDPANWFWVHNRWKPPPRQRPVPARPAPAPSGTL